MTKSSRALKRARQELNRPDRVLKARSPGDIVAMVPYVLGFYPAESVVVVALTGDRKRFGPTMRIDLVEPDEADRLVDYLTAVIAHHGFAQVLVAAFTERPLVAAAVIEPLCASLSASGVHVVEAVRTDGHRWWSSTCDDPGCCDPAGVAFDPASTPVAAEAVLAGLSQAPSREALRDRFAPADHTLQRAVADAAVERLEAITGPGGPHLSVAGLEQELTAVLGNGALAAGALGSLLAQVQFVELRDTAWMMMTRETAEEHFELWRQVVTAAPRELAAAAGSLAGFAAWLGGHGVLASHACDLVEAVSPTYSMNLLLREVLDGCLNPNVWDYPTRPGADVS